MLNSLIKFYLNSVARGELMVHGCQFVVETFHILLTFNIAALLVFERIHRKASKNKSAST